MTRDDTTRDRLRRADHHRPCRRRPGPCPCRGRQGRGPCCGTCPAAERRRCQCRRRRRHDCAPLGELCRRSRARRPADPCRRAGERRQRSGRHAALDGRTERQCSDGAPPARRRSEPERGAARRRDAADGGRPDRQPRGGGDAGCERRQSERTRRARPDRADVGRRAEAPGRRQRAAHAWRRHQRAVRHLEPGDGGAAARAARIQSRDSAWRRHRVDVCRARRRPRIGEAPRPGRRRRQRSGCLGCQRHGAGRTLGIWRAGAVVPRPRRRSGRVRSRLYRASRSDHAPRRRNDSHAARLRRRPEYADPGLDAYAPIVEGLPFRSRAGRRDAVLACRPFHRARRHAAAARSGRRPDGGAPCRVPPRGPRGADRLHPAPIPPGPRRRRPEPRTARLPGKTDRPYARGRRGHRGGRGNDRHGLRGRVPVARARPA